MTRLGKQSTQETSLSVRGASKLVIPSGIVSTAEPALTNLASALGYGFDDWQRDINRLILAKREDGAWACRNVVLSICRQAGKTYLVGFHPFLRCLSEPGFTAIWTTHHFSVTRDTFETLRSIALSDVLAPWVKAIHSAAGNESITFTNGSRLAFKARENGAIRGFKKVGLLVLDEAQHLTDSALASVIPTQNRAVNPQTIYMGTPPAPGMQGAVFSRHRQNALDGKAETMLYVEFSADRSADVLDRAQWAKANPSYPAHTSDEAIVNTFENLTVEDFRRESLGIWDEVGRQGAIPASVWESSVVASRREGGWIGLGVDMPPDRSSLAIGACMAYGDGGVHVELACFKATGSHGTRWAAQWIADRWDHVEAVVIDAQSPATVLVPELEALGVDVTLTSASQMGRACGMFMDALSAGRLTHLVQEPLDLAVSGAITRRIGHEGAFGWNKLGSDVDISPLVAVTLALFGAQMDGVAGGGNGQRMVWLP